MITADEAKALMPKNMDLKAIILANESLWDEVDTAITKAAEHNDDSVKLLYSKLKIHFDKMELDYHYLIPWNLWICAFTECLEDLSFSVIKNKIITSKYDMLWNKVTDYSDICWTIKW